MKTSHCLLLVAAAFFFGLQLGGRGEPIAVAQVQPTGQPMGRFQVAALAYPSSPSGGSSHGCYILDTATGELWSKIESQAVRDAGPPKIK